MHASQRRHLRAPSLYREGGDANLIAFNEGAAVRLSLCKNPFHKLSDCAPLLFYEVMRTHGQIRARCALIMLMELNLTN
jgi:hypothetical protein